MTSRQRLKDLDEEGIWGEVMYQSIGLWSSLIEDPAADPRRRARRERVAGVRDPGRGPRPPRARRTHAACSTSTTPSPSSEHAADIGLHLVSLPTGNPPGTKDWNDESWEPLWAAAEEAGMVIGFHIGTDGGDQAARFRGPGGAILNYVETTYGGQYAAMKLVGSGALERHPDLKVLISEGGATWVPFIGDRMNEAYRQHGMFVRPQLAKLPKEYLYRQVYASFQHDEIGARRHLGHGLQERHVRAATTPTSKARTATPRRRCTSCSTMSTPDVRRAHHPRRVRGALPARLCPSELTGAAACRLRDRRATAAVTGSKTSCII